MPGFSFAWPGPADGVGSLVSRQVSFRRGRTARPAGSSSVSIVVCRGSSTCHRYYDQLRLPSVHPTRLRHPARCVVPVFSAFLTTWIDLAVEAFPVGALVTRWTPTEDCSADDPRSRSTGDDEALTSSRVIPCSTCPGLRLRWPPKRLAMGVVSDIAFQRVDAVRDSRRTDSGVRAAFLPRSIRGRRLGPRRYPFRSSIQSLST